MDLVPDKDNIITTRLLLSSSEIGCFEGRDNSLSEMRRMTGANIQILPREERPLGISGADELLQVRQKHLHMWLSICIFNCYNI